MASLQCYFCEKPLQKALKGPKNRVYCGWSHRLQGDPDSLLQGGIGGIVLGLIMYFFLPGWTFRGTEFYLLLLIVGPIVLLTGLYIKYVMKPDTDVSTIDQQ